MSEKPFAPSAKRLREARQRGEVVRSVELNAAVGILAAAFLFRGPGETLVEELSDMLRSSISAIAVIPLDTTAYFRDVFLESVLRVLPGLAFVVLGMMVVGALSTVGQTGFLWASERLGFDFSRLNVFNGLKRIFSSQGLMEFAKAFIKLLAVGSLVYLYLKNHVEEVMLLGQLGLREGIREWAEMAYALAFRVGGAYLVVAGGDYAYQRWQFMKSLRMTREEMKEELRQSEGDPLIKSRIQQQQRRFARMRMMANVPKADVIITNPTHLAIAVHYDPQSMGAPVVLAKGAYHIAERIVELAKEHAIPVVQNVPLARAIYRSVEIDQEIPADLYLAMAEVLAFVYKLRAGKKPKRQRGGASTQPPMAHGETRVRNG